MAEIRSGSSRASPSTVVDMPSSSPQQSRTSIQTRDEKVEPAVKVLLCQSPPPTRLLIDNFAQRVETPKSLERRRSYNSFIEDSADREELPVDHTPKRQCRPDSADQEGLPLDHEPNRQYRLDSVDGSVLDWLDTVPGAESSSENRYGLGNSTGRAVEDGPHGNLAGSAQKTKRAEDMTDPAGVNDPNHRVTHLGEYSIVVEEDRETQPWRDVGSSQAPLKQQAAQAIDPNKSGVEENDDRFFGSSVSPDRRFDSAYGPKTSVTSTFGGSISKDLVLGNHDSERRVVKPHPDTLYGYSDWKDTFTRRQFDAHPRPYPTNSQSTVATPHSLMLPFFAIEFKAAAETSGHVWVAGNQCTRSSGACAQAVERLGALLHEHEGVHRLDEYSYSISRDHSLADLHISWKAESLDSVVERAGAFFLTPWDELDPFRQQVRKILDSAKDERFDQIRTAMNTILEGTTIKTARPASEGAHRGGRGRGRGRGRGGGRGRGRGRGRSHERGQEQARGWGRGWDRGRGRGRDNSRGGDRGFGQRLS